MDELEKGASARINGRSTNGCKKTLCVFASDPIGIVDVLLEVGGIYQLSDSLAPLICREIIDYVKFDDAGADALEQYNLKKVAYFYHEEKVVKKYRKKASQTQEKTLAKKLNGKVTPGSGAFGFHKGDVKTNEYLAEAKFTDAQEYRLTLQTWNKIKNEAYSVDKTPLMEVCLDQDGTPIKLIIIAPLDLFDKFNMDEDEFIDTFMSAPILPTQEDAKSVLLKKSAIALHIEDVNYNHLGKSPAFLINCNGIQLVGIETDSFVRMINA